MKCVQCGESTSVVRSREIIDGHGVSRTRVCTADSSHRFITVETPPRESLDRVAIQFSDGRLADHLFDRGRLASDLGRYTLGRLSPQQLRDVEIATIAELERRLPEEGRALSAVEQAGHRGAPLVAIRDAFIAEQMEEQLGRIDPVACILFALSTRGRLDHERAGWADAAAALDWLGRRFRIPITLPSRPEVESAMWHDPGVLAPQPDWVVGWAGAQDRPARRDPFDRARFVHSVARAFSGRVRRDEQSRMVVDWVLWGLRGQQTVMGGQLATGVLDCLRRVDDIAYLRWAAWAKPLDDIASFLAEATGLIRTPSPGLVLNASIRSPRPADDRRTSRPVD